MPMHARREVADAAVICRTRRATSAALLLALVVNGCALWEQPAVHAPMPTVSQRAPQPPLSAEATSALADAKRRVDDAKANRTLWKSAVAKLAAAEMAASKQDSANTLKLANEIVAICELSTAQAARPPVNW